MVAVFGAGALIGLQFYPEWGIPSTARLFPESHKYSEDAIPIRAFIYLFIYLLTLS